MTKQEKQIQDLVLPIVEGFGLYLVEVKFANGEDGPALTIFIDKKGGVSIEDCEKVHNAIDQPLDELDPTAGKSYTLNVSSAGLDREFKTDADFNRNIGEVLEVNLYQKLGACKKFVGQLICFDKDKIIIDKKGKQIEIKRNLISKATKYINF